MMRRWIALVCVLPLLGVTAAAQQIEPGPAEEKLDQAEIDRLQGMSLEELVRNARDLLDSEKYEAAVPYIVVARSRAEDDQEVKALNAELSLLKRDIKKARELFLEVYRANPNDYYANLGLGRLYLATRQFKQAEIYLEKAEQRAAQDQISLVRRLLAETYRGLKKSLKAVQLAEQAVNGRPDDYVTRQTLVMTLVEAAQLERAAEEAVNLEQIARDRIAADAADVDALQQLLSALQVHMLALQQSFQQLAVMGPGRQPTDQVLDVNKPRAAALSMEVAELQLMQAETARLISYHQILEFMKKAIEYVPDNADYQRDYGLLLMRTNQSEAAIAPLRRALELNPDDDVARRQLQALGVSLTAPAVQPPPTDEAQESPETQPTPTTNPAP